MKKVYFFSESYNTEFLKDIAGLEDLEVIKSLGLSPEEVLTKGYDYIFLCEGEFDLFKDLIGAISWKTNHLGVADALVRVEGGYKPVNLNADCILQILRSKDYKLDTSQSAMVIGTYDFVLSVAAKIALAGYSNILVSLFEKERVVELEKKMKDFIFNLKVKPVSLHELTLLQVASGLLISNVTPEMDKEAYETLTYFNFLTHGGVFVDFQSYSNVTLIEEAKRAELNVVGELEILTLKFKSLR